MGTLHAYVYMPTWADAANFITRILHGFTRILHGSMEEHVIGIDSVYK